MTAQQTTPPPVVAIDPPVDPAVEPPLAPPGASRRAVRLTRDVISYLEWPAGGRAGVPAGESGGVAGAPAGDRGGPSASERSVPDTGTGGRSAILLHGLQSTALTMTRIAEGLAAQGWHVVAPDLPGHGHSFALDGSDADRPGHLDVSRLTILRHRLSRRHRLRSTASVVTDLAAHLGLERPMVLGHSWGASVAAMLPAAGLLPSVLVLLDPPFVTANQARTLGVQAMAEPAHSYGAARDTLLTHRPDWHPVDLAAKAEALTSVSTRAMVAVVASNVPFDPLPALSRLRSRQPGLPIFVIMGEPGQGSFVSVRGRERLGAVLGDDHVLVMNGAGHSPHRTHYEEFMTLLDRALSEEPETA